MAVAEAALMIADRLGDADSAALSLRAKANVHYALGQNQTAIKKTLRYTHG
jgi:hypothetical protein